MRKRIVGPVALGLLLFAVSGPAGADPGEATHVDSLSATVGSSTIGVTGTATFVDVAALLGEDAAGDAFLANIGADLTTVTVSRPDPKGNTLKFTVGIADLPPTLNGVPEFVAYDWQFGIHAGDPEMQTQYRLHAQRTAQANSLGGVNPVFILYKCVFNPQTGINECTQQASLTGKMGDGVVEWNLPMSRIKAQAGSIITQAGTGIFSSGSASGALWGVPILDTAGMDIDYVVPGATVQLGIAPEGTPPELVPLTGTGTVNLTTGGFSGTLPKPAQPGAYTVAAQACYGSASCALAATTITVG